VCDWGRVGLDHRSDSAVEVADESQESADPLLEVPPTRPPERDAGTFAPPRAKTMIATWPIAGPTFSQAKTVPEALRSLPRGVPIAPAVRASCNLDVA
jgi:hypothetical protein